MVFEKIIEDVIRDYSRNNECLLNYKVFGKALDSMLSQFETKIEIGDAYALCMGAIYYLNEMAVLTNREGKDNIESVLKDFFSENLDDLLVKVKPYKWIPQELEEVLKQSYFIFEKAKECYFTLDVVNNKDNVDDVFSQITDARVKLNSLEYIYRSYNEIINIYERELSESQLDIDTIKGDKFLLSLRMTDYIDYIEDESMGMINEDVDFSVESPFMPDK